MHMGAFDKYMKLPGLDIFSMVNEIGLEVMSKTANRQQPWMTSGSLGSTRIFLRPPTKPTEGWTSSRDAPQ